MTRPSITARPLTREAFAPFGDVVSTDRPDLAARMVNFGTAERKDEAGELATSRPDARPNLATFRCHPWTRFPVRIEALEKHPCSSQLFVPMKVERFLVIVAPGGDAPDLANVVAFSGGPGQAIVYRPGTWHMPLITLGDEPADFVMLVWEDGTREDCIVANVVPPIEVTLPGPLTPSAGPSRTG